VPRAGDETGTVRERGGGQGPGPAGRRPARLWAHLARWVKLALVLALLCACGGCYDRIELNALAVVDIMGLDLTEDGLLKVSLQFLIPADLTNPGGVGAGAGLRDPFFIMEQTGETLPEAFSLLQAKVPRRLFTSHIRVIVIGEELARAGIGPVFDSLTRLRELRSSMSVVVTQGEAAALLQAAPRLGRLPVAALASTLEQKIVPIRSIREVAIALVSEGVDPFIPAVGLTSRIETQLEPGAPTQEFELIGAGIFRGDRLVGFAPLDLARGLAWLVDEAPFAVATIEWPPEGESSPREARPDVSPPEAAAERDAPPGSRQPSPGQGMREPNQISPLVLRAHVQFHTEIEDGQPVVHVYAHAVDDIVTNQAGLDLTDPAVLPRLEDALAARIKDRMEGMLHLARELGADVFGFGALIRRNHPKLWRELRDDWHGYFSRLPVQIHVDVRVQRTGLTNSPAIFRREQLRR